jgi:uridine kinase
MTNTRTAVLETIADTLVERTDALHSRVLRVAVTGITASGKTTLSQELAQTLTRRGRNSVQIAVDDFHNRRELRYRRGRESAEGYYFDAYNYPLLKKLVLEPLGTGGDLIYETRGFDLEIDAPVEEEPHKANPGDIFLFAASFLLRPELISYFDYRIYVDTDFEVAEQRGVERDLVQFGSWENAVRLYRQRYHAAQRIYFAESNPVQYADALLKNNNLAEPILFFRANNHKKGDRIFS